jgi:hypothetical protein
MSTIGGVVTVFSLVFASAGIKLRTANMATTPSHAGELPDRIASQVTSQGSRASMTRPHV